MPDIVGDADIEVGADGGKFMLELRAITAAAERMLARQGSRIGAALSKPLERPASRIGQIFQLIAVTAPFAVSGVSAIAGAASALAGSLLNTVIAGASFTGVVGAMGLGLVTTIVATRGLHDALAGTEGALAKLAPSAQSFVKAMIGARVHTDALRKAVQGAFFKGLADDVTRISHVLLPIFQSQLVGAAGTLNNVASAMSSFLTSSQGTKLIVAAMSGMNRILRELSGAALPLFRGLLTLFVGLVPSGVKLASLITDIANKFAAWSVGIVSSGRLAAIMDRAFESAKRVWGVVRNLGIILFNVFSGSSRAGDTFLAVLERVTGKFAAWTGSVAGQNAIASWAAKGTKALQMIGTLLTTLGPLFAQMAKPELFIALVAVLQSTGAALAVAAPLVNAVVSAFSKLLTFIAPVLGPLLAVGIAFKSFMFIANIIALVLRFSGILKLLQLALAGIRLAFASAWVAALGPIGWIIIAVAALGAAVILLWQRSETFRNIVTAVWNAIKAVAMSVVTWFTGTLVPWFQGVWTAISSGVTGFWTTVTTAFNAVLSAVTGFVTMVVGRVVAFVSQLVSIGVQILNAVTMPWRIGIALVIGVLNMLFQFVRPFIMALVNFVLTGFRTLWAGAVAIFNGLRAAATAVWNALRGAIMTVVNAVRSHVTAGFNLVRSVVTTVHNAIRGVITGVWNAVYSFISSIVSRIRSFVSAGFNALVGLVSAPLNRLRSVATTAFNNLVSAITGAIGRARSAATQVGQAVLSAITGFVGRMAGVGGDIVRGLIGGITGMAGTLRSAVSSFIANNVPAPVRKLLGIGSPSKLFAQFGKWTAEGLQLGLVGQARAVSKAAGTLGAATAKGFDSRLSVGGTPPPVPGTMGLASVPTEGSSGATTYGDVTVMVSVKDLEELKSLGEFLDMIKSGRVDARRKVGGVAA